MVSVSRAVQRDRTKRTDRETAKQAEREISHKELPQSGRSQGLQGERPAGEPWFSYSSRHRRPDGVVPSQRPTASRPRKSQRFGSNPTAGKSGCPSQGPTGQTDSLLLGGTSDFLFHSGLRLTG